MTQLKFKFKLDIMLALVMAVFLAIIMINGSHISPRESRYNTLVEEYNQNIDTMVLGSMNHLMDKHLAEVNADSDANHLAWDVPVKYADALQDVRANDAGANANITVVQNTFNNWLKAKGYTAKEIKGYKMQLFNPQATEKQQTEKELKKMRTKYQAAAREKISRAKEEIKEEARKASSAAEEQASLNASYAARVAREQSEAAASSAAQAKTSTATSTAPSYSSSASSAYSSSGASSSAESSGSSSSASSSESSGSEDTIPPND
ncbi:MAG: hypothetical protein LBT37_04520 [Lactobacillaceae bacterium]|jgi:hypothetical protein|nr:hypothetical protein [Lactobacillaceae bacterium]